MDAEIEKAKAFLDRMERQYIADGLRPVKWVPPPQEGCRACGDKEKGPFTVNVMSSKIPGLGEALLYVAVLCERCQSDEDRRDQAADGIVSLYLRSRNPN